MLVDGDLPAMISPDLPEAVHSAATSASRGCFPTTSTIEIAYFSATGIFPIMHVTTIKQEIVEQYPWVPTNLVKAFEAAKQSPTAHAKPAHGATRMGPHRGGGAGGAARPRPLGLWADAANRKNLETVPALHPPAGHDQQALPLDDLFADTDLGDAGGPEGFERERTANMRMRLAKDPMNFNERLADICAGMIDAGSTLSSPCMMARISSRSPIRCWC